MMNDTAYEALANEVRRTLLVDLLDEATRTTALAAAARGDARGLTTARRVETALYHNHLPKLVEYGFIEWDEESQDIGRGPEFEEIRPLLEWIDEHPER